jgi:hypothetical protein
MPTRCGLRSIRYTLYRFPIFPETPYQKYRKICFLALYHPPQRKLNCCETRQNLLVQMAGGTCLPARKAFSDSLLECLYGPEADAIKPLTTLDEGVRGLHFRSRTPSPSVGTHVVYGYEPCHPIAFKPDLASTHRRIHCQTRKFVW